MDQPVTILGDDEARSLGVLGDPWIFLILREVFRGGHTFTELRDSLGIATDVLAARLQSLVESGVLARVPYRLPGARGRDAYELTAAGHDLKVPLVALMQRGETHTSGRGRPDTTVTTSTGITIRAVLMDDDGGEVSVADVEFRAVRRRDRSPKAEGLPVAH